ncbi:MAG: hypothetical protein DRQ55_15265 [Planctomycetota bacterium]|nr:MAG: hypothetical protein DRQ55_15265 [Planctomycetota bacterium]
MLRHALLAVFLILFMACSGPTVQRGTDDPDIDQTAMSTRLDRADLEHAMDKWLTTFDASGFVHNLPSGNRTISVLEIKNETSEHIGSALRTLITSVETKLVNGGVFDVVANDDVLKSAIVQERLRGDMVDPDTMAALGKELGVNYFVHGRVGDTTEKLQDARRVQYTLFLKVTEVATRRTVFQEQIDITKQISS